jgi:dTDP-glucose pyrophosphorylase
MLGIIPAAGAATRLQPLAFSKEMLPVGSAPDERGVERPKAVSEFLVERMIHAGADRVCFVLSPELRRRTSSRTTPAIGPRRDFATRCKNDQPDCAMRSSGLCG